MSAPGGRPSVSPRSVQPPPAAFKTQTLDEWLEEFSLKVERRGKHVNALSIALVVIAALYIVSGIALGAFFISAPAWDETLSSSDRVILPVIGFFLLIVFVMLGVWPAISAWGLRKRKEWGRWSAVIFCVLTSPISCGSICCLPVSIWGLWALIGPEADGVFGHDPKPPPHLIPLAPSQQRERRLTPVDNRKAQPSSMPAAQEPEPGPGAPADAPEPQPSYAESAKPSERTPIPVMYPRPRVSNKTPPEGLYRYEPRTPPADLAKNLGKESDGDRPDSYSSIPTADDIPKPKPDKT
jgi:hypothetical protein